MKDKMIRCLSVILVTTQVISLTAADTTIGMATVRGSFHIDGSKTSDQATLFSGTRISTATASSELRLHNGSKIVLAPGSDGAIFADHVVLQRGGAQMEANTTFRLQTGDFRVEPLDSTATAQLSLGSRGAIHVSSVRGALAVRSVEGVLLAKLAQGRSADLTPESKTESQPNPTKYEVTGKVFERDGHYFITDETTGTTYELTGKDIEKRKGKRIKAAGILLSSTAAIPVIAVSSVTAVAVGISATAIIAGVVVASAAATGAGIALTRDDTPSNVSR